MKIDVLPALCLDQMAALAAARASVALMERFGLRFHVEIWDGPTIVAREGEQVIGLIQHSRDDTQRKMHVDFAWADPSFPRALLAMAARLRAIVREAQATRLTFACHPGNEQMAKLARVLKARVVSTSYEIAMSGGARNG